jgi:hypothetical protein
VSHLFVGQEVIKEIRQIPIQEERPGSKKAVLYQNADGSVSNKNIDRTLLEKEEDDDVVLMLREKLAKEVR